MRILGIDPGSLATGWGLVGGTPARPRLLECGVIRLPQKQPMVSRLARLQGEFVELVSRLEPQEAAVEAPFQGAHPRAAIQLAHARGVVLAVLGAHGVGVGEYPPATVKQSVTGNGRAEKRQVGFMVDQILGRVHEATHDVHDALAVALCHATRRRLSTLETPRRPRAGSFSAID